MPEAPVRISKNGIVVDGEGWFVINARESRWRDEGPLGTSCTFEGKRRFPPLGINISVFQPGQRMSVTTAKTPRKHSSCFRVSAL